MDEHFIESNAYSVKHVASMLLRTNSCCGCCPAPRLGGFWPAKFFIERAEMEAVNAGS